ncbi:MAG: LysM peptidoglycan-binding domain-containing protein [Balneolaceae bacterium]|nr:LysM peptidoglycan-binding domain-containing protein [Balneolaceae bacterium]MBO6545793.1 LysM peptidoglycan-binding domain-containing protein [Balneolaceae bacterium]MBO6647189.1 LysM peptidoglycan-binding domain-containing protein [Balneolaceae bacterium]
MKLSLSFFGLIFLLSISLSAQEQQTYTVKQGETLYGISKLLNVTVAELQQWNNLSDNAISIGDELIYYTSVSDQPAATEPPAKSLIEISAPQENTYYTVKSGDNLTVIARQHTMTVQELKDLNNLTSDLLSIGQQLSVRKLVDSVAPSASEFSEESQPQGSFAVYTVQSGETSTSILEKFKMTQRELQELNPQVNIAALDRNQKITVLLPPSRSYDNPYENKASLQDLGSVGVSSYGSDELGNTTTNGELYDPKELTAAHSNIALGTIIYIENPETKSGLYVRINDRITESGLKLSAQAFRILGLDSISNPTVSIYTES